ncbi:hypothetical protein [Salinispora oceanensis]|uniref:hypothetical protein n=1 Tax=Salinispora oceanensis TaxID=1050199 RepID=UPI000476950F|nr:hypothetical protein [Salinispora oceanensis]
MRNIRNAWRRLIDQSAPIRTGAKHRFGRQPARVDTTGPTTRYAARAGAYHPLRNQSTVIFDTRPLMTPLARQRADSR